MTVIAWGGKTLAADKRTCSGGLARTVTKIRRIGGHLVGVPGDFDKGVALFAWFEQGADPASWPAFQGEADWCGMLVITPAGEIRKYEQTPYPITFEDDEFAIGSGRDYAVAAMRLGCDARRAVEVAIALDASCGNGIDLLEIE